MFPEYSFRQIIYIIILSILLAIAAFYINQDSYLSNFYSINLSKIRLLFFVFLTILLITSLVYQRTLVNYDEPTILTNYASLINVLIWSTNWIWWGISNSKMMLQYPIKSQKIELFSFLFSLGLPLIVFSFTLITNLQEIKENNESVLPEKDGFLYKWYSYSGFYSLIGCIIYLIFISEGCHP